MSAQDKLDKRIAVGLARKTFETMSAGVSIEQIRECIRRGEEAANRHEQKHVESD